MFSINDAEKLPRILLIRIIGIQFSDHFGALHIQSNSKLTFKFSRDIENMSGYQFYAGK